MNSFSGRHKLPERSNAAHAEPIMVEVTHKRNAMIAATQTIVAAVINTVLFPYSPISRSTRQHKKVSSQPVEAMFYDNNVLLANKCY